MKKITLIEKENFLGLKARHYQDTSKTPLFTLPQICALFNYRQERAMKVLLDRVDDTNYEYGSIHSIKTDADIYDSNGKYKFSTPQLVPIRLYPPFVILCLAEIINNERANLISEIFDMFDATFDALTTGVMLQEEHEKKRAIVNEKQKLKARENRKQTKQSIIVNIEVCND